MPPQAPQIILHTFVNHISAIMSYDFEISDLNKCIEDIANTYEKATLINRRQEILESLKNAQNLSSEELSDFINKNISRNIIFVIGGSNGLSSSVLDRSDYRLSFSKLTFPHQLFRVILLEQIYRSFKIINNEAYHK